MTLTREAADLCERLARADWGLAAGVSLGVMMIPGGEIAVVACDQSRELRLEISQAGEGLDEGVTSLLEALDECGFMGTPVSAPDLGSWTVQTDLRAFASDAAKPGHTLLLFAGRAIAIPEELSPLERRAAFERFLASGRGRVLAQSCLTGGGCLAASAPPVGLRAPEGGTLSVFEEGAWRSASLGGGVGPLGAARTLRTWKTVQFVSTSACHLRLNSPDGSTPPVGGSVGPSEEHTRLRAVAEACERYTAGVVDRDRVQVGSRRDLGEKARDPREFISYLDWQVELFDELHPFSDDEQRLWVDAVDQRGETFLVLADLVFYPFGRASHRRHVSATSSGMAAHSSSEAARSAAVFELLERDAFMRLWLGEGQGRKLTGWEAEAPPEMTAALAEDGWDVEMLQIGSGAEEPILMAIALREGSIAVGASAASPTEALRKSLSELWSTTTEASQLDEAPRTQEDVLSPRDHTLFALTGRLSPPSYATGSVGEVGFNDLDEAPRRPRDVLFHEWDKRLTDPFHVVRALSPSLIPISFGFGQEPYGREDVQELLGEKLPGGLDSCPAPHAFP